MKNRNKPILERYSKFILAMHARITAGVQRVHICWAEVMHKAVNGLSTGKRILIVLCFFLAMSFAFTVPIIMAFLGPPPKSATKVTGSFRSIIPVMQPSQPSGSRPDSGIVRQLSAFEHYLDSLEKTEKGRIEKKRLIKAHPGMMDSVKRIRELFNIQ